MGKYETLLRVAELKNVTKAAEELGYSQPNISHIIRRTEEELGVRLFNRGNRSILSLTPAGAELIPLMRQAEEAERTVQRVARSYRTDTLRIGCFYSVSVYWLPFILERFMELEPQVRVSMVQSDSYSELEAMLTRGDIDCSFYAGHYSRKFETAFLCKDPYYVVVSRKHPLASALSVSIRALERYGYIPPSEAFCSSIAQTALRKINNTARITMNSQEDLVTLSMVELDLGITLLPGLIARNTNLAVTAVPLEEDISRDVGILFASSRNLPAVVKKFIRVTKEVLEELSLMP